MIPIPDSLHLFTWATSALAFHLLNYFVLSPRGRLVLNFLAIMLMLVTQVQMAARLVWMNELTQQTMCTARPYETACREERR